MNIEDYLYHYKAEILEIKDGDTIKVRMSLGDDVYKIRKLRFDGLDAPELKTQAGKVALAWVLTKLSVGDVIIIKTKKDKSEKFGRLLCEVHYKDKNSDENLEKSSEYKNLNTELLESGHAVPYFGGKRA